MSTTTTRPTLPSPGSGSDAGERWRTSTTAAVAVAVGSCVAVIVVVLIGHLVSPSGGALAWAALGLALLALAPWAWLVATGTRTAATIAVGVIALAAVAGLLVDALDATVTSHAIAAGIAACLAVHVALLTRAGASVPGPRSWPRGWLLAAAIVIAVAGGVWLAVEGVSASAYDAVMAVAIGAAPNGLATAVLAPVVVGVARAQRLGITVRHTDACTRAAAIQGVVLDGLGTLVAGKHVTKIEPIEESHLRNLRWFAGALAHAGDDDTSHAIARLAVRGNLSGVSHSADEGLVGNVDRHPVRLTSPALIGLSPVDAGVTPGETIGVEVDRRPLGTIRVEDSVRPGSADAVESLRHLGLDPVLISEATAPTTAAVMGESGVKHLVPRSHDARDDLAAAIALSPASDANATAVIGPSRPAGVGMADVLHIGPDSELIAVADPSADTGMLALRISRAIGAVTAKARIVAIIGQVVVIALALSGILTAWAAALGAALVCGLTWAIVWLIVPRTSTDLTEADGSQR